MSRLVTFMWNGRPYTINVDREADDPAWDVLRQSLRNAVAAGLSPDDVYRPMSRGEPLALFEIISITHDMSDVTFSIDATAEIIGIQIGKHPR